MSFTQFSMVEELASLVKDNLPCKHLVLSVEEALLNLLQDETSSDAVLELEPMNPYNRLLIHRLADIFGFSHHSVGEGDERHIVLQRCPDSSIPSMLVIDLLWEYDEQYARLPDVQAKPSESSHGYNNIGTGLLECSLKDRQEAYLAARERIFSVDDYETGEPLKQRPPKNPVVARRMIVHALGRQAKSSTEDNMLLRDSDSNNVEILNEKQKDSILNTGTCLEKTALPEKHSNNSCIRWEVRDGSESSHSGMRLPLEKVDKTSTKSDLPRTERTDYDIQKEKKEHTGAARRIFANALGFQPRNGNNAPKSRTKKETLE